MDFVTGGTGLVGSHLLLELLKKGHKIRALKRKTSNIESVRKVFSLYTEKYQEYFEAIDWVEGDLLDIYFIEEVLNGIEVIYHCAAQISFDHKQRKSMIINNVQSTANLVNAALIKQVKKICYVSSSSALGKAEQGFSITEETFWIPSRKNSGYSESKFFSEANIWRGVEEGIEAVVVIPTVIIGPGKWNSSSSKFFLSVYEGLRFYPGGITGFVDVRDVADVICMLMKGENFEKSKNQRFILSAENIRYYDFFHMIATALHVRGPHIFVSNLLIYLALGFSSLWSVITGQKTQISRDTLINANKENFFDGSKVVKMFDFRYRPIEDAIKHTADCFLRDQSL